MSKLTLSILMVLVPSVAMASGYEKTNNFGGRAAGVGGAVIGDTRGAEAVYFNPAGVAGREGFSANLNFSPTFSKFDGKAQFLDRQVEGSRQFSPIFGALFAYGINEKLSIGTGFYAAGGAKAKQENMDYTPLSASYDTLKPTTKADLQLLEYAIGPSYEIMPGLRIGAMWRISMVKADFSFVKESALPAPLPAGSKVLVQTDVTSASATRFNGMKFGIQYEDPAKTWGVGLNWRTEVSFIAKGTSSGTREFNTLAAAATTQSGSAALVGGNATIANAFPQQIALGGYFKVGDAWTILPGYDFTEYSVNRQLDVEGSIGIPVGAQTVTSPLTDISQGWRNQHVFRLGAEYGGFGVLKLRGGYSLTTQVTPTERSKSFISSPGSAHYFNAGAGYALNEMITLDGALEYAFGGGTGFDTADSTTSGDFKSSAFTLHTGVTMNF